jgi:signal transduction histidine kinase
MVNADYLSRLHKLSQLAALAVIGVGWLVLCGWWLGIPVLYRISPQLPQVEPTSAVAFMLTGFALFALQPAQVSGIRLYTGRTLALLGCFLGFLGLAEYFGWVKSGLVNAHLSQWLGVEILGGNMSPHPALIFTLTNIALLLLSSNQLLLVKITQISALLGGMALVSVFLGYAYQEDVFFRVFGETGMALHSATAFAILGWGIVLARVECSMLQVMVQDTAGGTVARRVISLIALFPFLLGWLPLVLATEAFTHKEVESVLTTLLLLGSVIAVVRLAYRLDHQETQYRAAQEAARQHQSDLAHVARLNTMGEMASGLAHELNQPLAAIANYAAACQRLSQHGESPERLAEALERIQQQAQRASQIIRRLRSFVRKQLPQKVEIPLETLIRDALVLIKHQADRMHVPILLDVRKGLPPARVDTIQIEQVILNIVQNALDAMKTTPSHQRQIFIRAFVNPEHLFQIDIRDTGAGMNEALQASVFDAFVTTKGDGGMGIGLALCRSIIEAHGGQLWLESKEGQGATFSFTLLVD